MTHEVTDRHPAHALRRCATTPEDSLSAPGERGDVRSADTILHSNPIRRSAAMTHGDSDRHPAQALRRCATSHSLPSFRRARGMSAARTRFQLTPDCVRGRATNAACTARGAAEAQACFCFLDKTGCASEKSKFQASLILLF